MMPATGTNFSVEKLAKDFRNSFQLYAKDTPSIVFWPFTEGCQIDLLNS